MNLIDLISEAQINHVRNPKDFAHEVTTHYRTWLIPKKISDEINLKFDEEILKLTLNPNPQLLMGLRIMNLDLLQST